MLRGACCVCSRGRHAASKHASEYRPCVVQHAHPIARRRQQERPAKQRALGRSWHPQQRRSARVRGVRSIARCRRLQRTVVGRRLTWYGWDEQRCSHSVRRSAYPHPCVSGTAQSSQRSGCECGAWMAERFRPAAVLRSAERCGLRRAAARCRVALLLDHRHQSAPRLGAVRTFDVLALRRNRMCTRRLRCGCLAALRHGSAAKSAQFPLRMRCALGGRGDSSAVGGDARCVSGPGDRAQVRS